MTISEIVLRRNITEIFHFTTHRGLLGTLHSGAVKSRRRLPTDVDLKFIYKPNAEIRKDLAWLDYVNLSISRVNLEFFAHSCRWHRAENLWWCVMAFDPDILAHPGVHFATTNNMYTGARRAPGPSGLEQLFAPKVTRYSTNVATRLPSSPASWTTCMQAEVLYPGELPVQYLRRIYVERGEDQDEVCAQLNMMNTSLEVVIDPAKFGQVGDECL